MKSPLNITFIISVSIPCVFPCVRCNLFSIQKEAGVVLNLKKSNPGPLSEKQKCSMQPSPPHHWFDFVSTFLIIRKFKKSICVMVFWKICKDFFIKRGDQSCLQPVLMCSKKHISINTSVNLSSQSNFFSLNKKASFSLEKTAIPVKK